MKKILNILLACLVIVSLAGCGAAKKVSGGEEANPPEQTERQEDNAQQENKNEDKKDEKNEEKQDEYVRDKWITDNLSISFYSMYQEGGENTLYTLNVCGGNALMLSKKGDAETVPGTYYKQSETGVTTYTLLHAGESKSALKSAKEQQGTFKENLPKVMLIGGTFAARGEKELNFNKYEKRSGEYIGRDCDIYEEKSAIGSATVIIDKETGIILKNEAKTTIGEKSQTVTSVLVTELKYGGVTEADATVNLDEYEISEY